MIEGIRDLVTNDRDYSDTVSLIRGSNVTKLRMGKQNGTDYQCGWVVSGAIAVDTTLYPSTHGGNADGGVTDVNTSTVAIGKSLSAVSATADILTFIFNLAL